MLRCRKLLSPHRGLFPSATTLVPASQIFPITRLSSKSAFSGYCNSSNAAAQLFSGPPSAPAPVPTQPQPPVASPQTFPTLSTKSAASPQRPSHPHNQMLSRYRSVSVVNADDINPVIQFEEAAEYRCWRGTRADDKGLGALRTALRLWDGPLAGIAHQEGQFVALEEGPAGEDAALPPEGLAQALSLDLELLLGLAELTSDVVIDSEGESAVVPIILEPRLDAAGATQSAVSSAAATAIAAQPSTVQPSNYTEPQLSESAVLTAPGSGPVESGSGGGAGGGDGGWWSLAEAVATPLTWEEVAASLGVASELAAEMKPPTRFETKEAFLSHMLEQHVSILLEGRADWLAEAEAKAMAAAMVEAAPDDPWVTRSTPAAAAAAAAAGAAAAAAAAGAATTAAGDEDLEQRQRRAVSEAAALAAAVRQLSGAVVFPAALEVTLWSNALGWNPVLLMWVGRSRRSGAILGLLTTMIWT